MSVYVTLCPGKSKFLSVPRWYCPSVFPTMLTSLISTTNYSSWKNYCDFKVLCGVTTSIGTWHGFSEQYGSNCLWRTLILKVVRRFPKLHRPWQLCHWKSSLPLSLSYPFAFFTQQSPHNMYRVLSIHVRQGTVTYVLSPRLLHRLTLRKILHMCEDLVFLTLEYRSWTR